jgi:hypothetical protein
MVDDDVDAFLASTTRAPELQELDAAITRALPGLTRVLWRGPMWGGTDQAIVGYGSIRQPRPRGSDVEWFLVGLAEQKRHLSIYVNAAEDGAYLVQRFADRLGRVKVGAAAVTFSSTDDLDLEGLHALLLRARELAPDAR